MFEENLIKNGYGAQLPYDNDSDADSIDKFRMDTDDTKLK